MFKIPKINLILIFLIILIIISGFFIFNWAQIKEKLEETEIKFDKEKPTITIEKTEYKQGEKVRVSLDYEESLYVWNYPWSSWSVQRKVNNSWINLKLGFIAFDFFSPCEVECKDVSLNKIADCKTCRLEAPAWDLKKGKSISFAWNQNHIINEEIYQCYQKGKIITRKCVIYRQVPLGEYKIRFEYALTIKNRNIKEGVNIQSVEKEFRIVE
jgi:hypothetical protein